MKIKFWGVRGSIPTPLKPSQLQSKLAAVIQRIQPSDVVSQEARLKFLSNIPSYLYDTPGGNTTCVEVRTKDNTCIIFDAGSGIRELGINLLSKKDKTRVFHIFFSHFHWDHIMGLPFFDPAYIPGYEIHFYSPFSHMEECLRTQMESPHFPVSLDVFGSNIYFHYLKDDIIKINNTEVRWKRVKHPGGSISYKVSDNNKNFIFSTDTELTEQDFRKNTENHEFYSNTDIIVLDSQYTLGEAIEKYDWGHTAYSVAIDFASAWRIPKLILFHHEPKYSDKKLYENLKAARGYERLTASNKVEVDIAQEEMEIIL